MVSSLKNLCRIPGLVEILNHPNIKKEIFSWSLHLYNYDEVDEALQRVVSEFLEDYNLVVKRNIPRHLILFVGFEMSNWAEDLKKHFNWSLEFSRNFIKSSFFTSKGLIGEEKAARELVNEPSFNPFFNYKIACCEDIITGLWQELLNNEPNFKEWFKENNPECPMVLWSNYLEMKNDSVINQDVETHEFKEKVFSYGLKNKNLAAVNFSWSFEFSQNFIKSSFFTSKGLIDEEKAARELVNEPSFNPFFKYKIACQYFLEDIIPGLWQELRNNEPNFKEWFKKNNHECPMVMWTNYLEMKNDSVINEDVETHEFKDKVFSYGLKNKNLAAVKFSYGPQEGSREIKEEIKMRKPLVYTSYCDFLKRALKDIDFYEISADPLLDRDNLADRNIIIFFLSLMNKMELKEFFINFENSINIVRWFLLWPYQNQFMDLAQIIWENFGIEEFGKLMYDIILIHSDKYICPSYNYRLLLREFWIKSPSLLKEQIISSESGELYGYRNELIKMLYTLPNFTEDDLDNINLILESANSDSRKKIFLYQGNSICNDLILTQGNFTLANMFLESMDLDLETLQKFKNDFIIDSFPNIMNNQSITLFEEIFKWVVGNNEIDDFKDEIFHRLTNSNKTEHLFLELKEKTPFSFLKQTVKWFLKTDEKVVQWEKNIEYSPFIEYSRPDWFDRLLKYRGYSDEEASDIKKNVFLERLPEIAKALLSLREVIQNLETNIPVLCSFKKEILIEFIDLVRSFYKNSIKEKHCLLCLNNDHVYWNGDGAPLYCEHHGTNGIINLDRVNEISCIFLNRVERLLPRKDWVLYMRSIM